MRGKKQSAPLFKLPPLLSLVASVELRLCITRPQCRLICCSKGAEDRDKDLQGSRDRRQDHLNGTQISKADINHSNLFAPETVQQTLLLSQNFYSWRRVRSSCGTTLINVAVQLKEEAANPSLCFVHFFLSSLPRTAWTKFSLHEVLLEINSCCRKRKSENLFFIDR